MKTTWNDLGVKERLAITSACVGFVCGWVLTGVAAFVPLLLSEQAVLWILAQSLTYASAVFGVSMYFSAEARQMKADISRHIEHMERMQMQREKLRHGIDTPEIPDKEDEDVND